MNKSLIKRWIVVIGGLLLVVLVLGGIKAGQIVTMVRANESFAPPPEAVTTARVEAAQWEPTTAAIGSLVAERGVTLGAELPGKVTEIDFESGGAVKKGQVLVRLDTSAEEAQLAAATADASLARVTLARVRNLRREEAVAQADLDTAEARAKQAEATIANLRATLAKKAIRAPFDGRISIRQVELGQIVSPGTPVASLQSVTPIHADFWLPQQALASLSLGQRSRLRVDTFGDATWDGEITAVNPEVDAATRNVRVRATFENPGGRLRPGMFANVEVVRPEKKSVVTVPATAVLYAPYGDSVFTVEQGKDPKGNPRAVAKQRFVRLGERRGDFVAVASGLSPGDVVVSSGAFKLRNGAAVAVNDKLAPQAQIAPTPADE